jgi:predicted enzyme related to lactoylglutathione lyase
MDVFRTHGAFSWSELRTTDVAAARDFYSRLFGWGMREMAMPDGTYTTCQVGEVSVAGMTALPPQAPDGQPHWACYVTVADVEATQRKAVELGGKVLTPAFDVPNVGRMAVIQDPQGAVLSIIAYAMPDAR